MRKSYMRSLLCLLMVSGPALAATYNDVTSDNWDEPATWDLASVYPGSGDTAIIDSHTVTANVAIDPNIALVDLQTGGELYVARNQTAGVQLSGGTLSFGTGVPTDWVNGTVGLLTVAADSTIKVINNDWHGYDTALFGITGTGKLTYRGGHRLLLYNNHPTFSGGWEIYALDPQDTTAGQLCMGSDGCLGTGTVTANSGGTLSSGGVNQTSAGATPAAVILNPGGTFHAFNADVNGAWRFILNGGTIRGERSRGTGADTTIDVQADSYITGGTEIGHTEGGVFYSTITGASDTTTLYLTGGAGSGGVRLAGTATGYKGNWEVVSGQVQIYTADAIGDNSGGTFLLNPGTTLKNNYAGTVGRNIILNQATYQAGGGGRTHSGSITLEGDSTILCDTSPGLTVSGVVTESGGPHKLIVTGGDGTGALQLTNTGNSYTGGTLVGDLGSLTVTADGQLGQAGSAGIVTIDGGKMQTSSASAVLTAVGTVDVINGTLTLDSTELSSTKLIFHAGAALGMTGGSTPLDYTPGTGNIQLYTNSILDSTIWNDPGKPQPTADQIQGGGQIYKGYSSNPTAEETVGPDPVDPWKGLATAGNNLSITTTIRERNSGQGFSLYTHLGRTMDFNGATLIASGPIGLEGAGVFKFIGTTNLDQASTVSASGPNKVVISNANGLQPGKTLNLSDGAYLMVENAAAINNAATVNLNSSGGISVDRALTTGTITVNDGGAVYANSGTYLDGGMTIQWNGHGQLRMPSGNGSQAALDAAAGKADFIQYYSNFTPTYTFGLSDSTRLFLPDNNPWRLTSGTFITSSGSLVNMSAAPLDANGYGGIWWWADNPDIGLADKTLVVGDTEPFHYFDGTSWRDVDQNGWVYAHGNAKILGGLEVKAGTFCQYTGTDIWSNAELIGLETALVRDGATWFIQAYNSGDALSMQMFTADIRGSGKIQVSSIYTGDGDRTLRIVGTTEGGVRQGSIGPGDTAGAVGKLTVSGHLAFGPPIDSSYARLEIDVLSDGDVPGTDHDQLSVTGTANITTAQLVVALPLPSGSLNPNEVNAVVLDAGTLTGQFASVVRGAATEHHWDIGLDDVAYAKGTVSVVLDADDWTGFGGDADLNGVVNYLDLGVLATNYDLTEGSGGAPVPEPAALVVLALGAVGLLRRRR